MRDYAFGNLVTKLRTELGFSQFQLGKLIGVSDKAVSKWENGNAKPRIATCCRLADILGVSLDELLSAAGYARRTQMESPEDNTEAVLMREEKRIMGRQDSELEKRIELHLRTGMSSADGVASAGRLNGGIRLSLLRILALFSPSRLHFRKQPRSRSNFFPAAKALCSPQKIARWKMGILSCFWRRTDSALST